MRIYLEIPDSGAAAFMAKNLERAGMPPEAYVSQAVERAAERDLAEVYRLFLARMANLPPALEDAN